MISPITVIEAACVVSTRWPDVHAFQPHHAGNQFLGYTFKSGRMNPGFGWITGEGAWGSGLESDREYAQHMLTTLAARKAAARGDAR